LEGCKFKIALDTKWTNEALNCCKNRSHTDFSSGNTAT